MPRLRNITGAREEIANSPLVITQPMDLKGQWNKRFDSPGEIRVEIGMGKGRFLYEMARQNPDVNFIGIEKYSSVLLKALRRQEEETLPNLILVRMEAELLTEVFAPGEVSRIYLNFSDPWPKERHAKRRLPSREFLRRFEKVLIPGGILEFKTDNTGLFDFGLEELKAEDWELIAVSRDLHSDSSLNAGNVMTEYEMKFSEKGNPICKYIARLRGDGKE